MRENGQSLIEVLAALAVVLLVVLALVVAVTTSVKSSDFARKRTQASSFAQQGMEKARSYRDQNSWATFSTNCGNLSALGLSSTPAPSFTLTVSCVDEGSSTKKKIIVTVSWTDTSGTHNSQLISYFTKRMDWK